MKKSAQQPQNQSRPNSKGQKKVQFNIPEDETNLGDLSQLNNSSLMYSASQKSQNSSKLYNIMSEQSSSGYRQKRSTSPGNQSQNMKSSQGYSQISNKVTQNNGQQQYQVQIKSDQFEQKIMKMQNQIQNNEIMINNLNKAFKLQNQFQNEWEFQIDDIKQQSKINLLQSIEQTEQKMDRKIEEAIQDILMKKRFDDKINKLTVQHKNEVQNTISLMQKIQEEFKVKIDKLNQNQIYRHDELDLKIESIEQLAHFSQVGSSLITEKGAEIQQYDIVRSHLSDFEANLKKQNEILGQKLQKQIMSTLKFSKQRSEDLQGQINKIVNSVAVDISSLRSNISELNNGKIGKRQSLTAMSVASIDGMVLTENGDALDFQKVQSQISFLQHNQGKLQFEITKNQNLYKQTQKSIQRIVGFIYKQDPIKLHRGTALQNKTHYETVVKDKPMINIQVRSNGQKRPKQKQQRTRSKSQNSKLKKPKSKKMVAYQTIQAEEHPAIQESQGTLVMQGHNSNFLVEDQQQEQVNQYYQETTIEQDENQLSEVVLQESSPDGGISYDDHKDDDQEDHAELIQDEHPSGLNDQVENMSHSQPYQEELAEEGVYQEAEDHDGGLEEYDLDQDIEDDDDEQNQSEAKIKTISPDTSRQIETESKHQISDNQIPSSQKDEMFGQDKIQVNNILKGLGKRNSGGAEDNLSDELYQLMNQEGMDGELSNEIIGQIELDGPQSQFQNENFNYSKNQSRRKHIDFGNV